MKRQIIAVAGGGFSEENKLTDLDEYLLDATQKKKPRILFIGTASGDAQGYIDKFYSCYTDKRCNPSHLNLFRRSVQNIEKLILQQDIVFVGGGNTVNMLAIWEKHGVDKPLIKAWRNGTILSGISAGALCWFDGGITDSFGYKLLPFTNGLGLLKGSFTPHCSSEANRVRACKAAITSGRLKAGYAVDDDILLHFTGQSLHRVYKKAPELKARYISKTDTKLIS